MAPENFLRSTVIACERELLQACRERSHGECQDVRIVELERGDLGYRRCREDIVQAQGSSKNIPVQSSH